MMKSFKNKIVHMLPRKFVYCDVGARWGVSEPWKHIRQLIDLMSFEPDKDEYEELNRKKKSDDKVFHYALFDKPGTIPLYLTRSRGSSSVYEPDMEVLSKYPDAERFAVEKRVSVDATTLDTLYDSGECNHIDFIKVDVQGAELNVLKGGEKFLREHILGIEVEVEFQPLYKNQPLFSDVDAYIREALGLELQDIRKQYWKYNNSSHAGSWKGQAVFGDALYFRSPGDIISWCGGLDKKEAGEKIVMACVMGLAYGYIDYSLHLLELPETESYLDRNTIRNVKDIVLSYGEVIKYNGKGSARLSMLFHILCRFFQPVAGGWSASDYHLGTRKKSGIFH